MKTTISILLLLLITGTVWGQNQTQDKGRTLIFKFKTSDDGFYASVSENSKQLNELYTYIDLYKDEILNKRLPIELTGYCDESGGADRPADLHLGSIRASRVKAEMIANKGLNEDCFVTHALSYPYNGLRDVVVVAITVAAPKEKQINQSAQPASPTEQPWQQPKEPSTGPKEPSTAPEPQPKQGYVTPMASVAVNRGAYALALSGNLLYMGALIPNLGVEWVPYSKLGVLLNGAFAKWDFDGGNKHHRVWMISPELRCYPGNIRRFYFGGMFITGQFNVKYSNTGYQGNATGGGLVAGYSLPLSKVFNLDFGLGLGFLRADYERYRFKDGVNVVDGPKRSRDYWGPTKAGVSLVWKGMRY